MNKWFASVLCAGMGLGTVLGADSSGEFIGTANTYWGNASAWANSTIASGAGMTLSMNRNTVGGHREVSLGADYTIGNIIITDTRNQPTAHRNVTFHLYNTTVGNGNLTLDGNGGGVTISSQGSSSLTLNGGMSDQVSVIIKDDVRVINLTGNGGYVTFNGNVFGDTVTTKNLILQATNQRINMQGVIGGNLRLVANGSAAGNYIFLGNSVNGVDNTYTGGTLIENDASIRMFSGGAFGSGAVTINGGNRILVQIAAAVTNNSILNDFVLETDGYFATSTEAVSVKGVIYSGNISGVGALTIANNGSSTMMTTLCGTNSYQGGTVLAGRVSISSDANLGASGGAVTMQANGFLDTTSSWTTNRQLNMGANATLGIGLANTLVKWDGKITGGSRLTKNYAGSLELSNGTNDYSGGTNVAGGKLIVSNTVGSATGTGWVTMGNNNTTLTGSGRIAPAAGNSITFEGTGKLDPRGTMTFAFSGASQLVLSDAMTIELDLSAGDKVAFETAGDWVSGAGASALKLSLTGISVGDYMIFENVTSALALDAGYDMGIDSLLYTTNFRQVGDDWMLEVAAVPEASTYAVLLGLGVLAGVMVRKGRRKN